MANEEKDATTTATEDPQEETPASEDASAKEVKDEVKDKEAAADSSDEDSTGDAATAESDDQPDAAAEESEEDEGVDDDAAEAASQEETTQQQSSQEEETQDDTDNEDEEDTSSSSEHEVTIEQLLKAGSHFGHLTSRWHPRMEPYIFMKRNNIHIIDLMQTQVLLDQAADAARRFAKRGRTILFAGTKKQAQQIVRNHAEESDQPHMVNRWLGGTMTNFQTIRRSIRRMDKLEKMEKDGTFDKLKKKERLTRIREREKLEEVLGGIRTMPDLPGALFIVDIKRERIAVNEARKLGIPIIAMVDTNCDPTVVDYPIPANDDALSSIELITSVIAKSIQEGAAQREAEEQAKKAEKQAKQQG